MVDMEKAMNWILKNKGVTAGTALGLFIGWLIIEYGFIKAVFVSICAITGYYIGKQADRKTNWKNIFSGRSED